MPTVTGAALLAVVLSFASSADGQDAPPEAEIDAWLDAAGDLIARPLVQRGEKWECVPAHRFVCTLEGCERDSGRTSVRLSGEGATVGSPDPPPHAISSPTTSSGSRRGNQRLASAQTRPTPTRPHGAPSRAGRLLDASTVEAWVLR